MPSRNAYGKKKTRAVGLRLTPTPSIYKGTVCFRHNACENSDSVKLIRLPELGHTALPHSRPEGSVGCSMIVISQS